MLYMEDAKTMTKQARAAIVEQRSNFIDKTIAAAAKSGVDFVDIHFRNVEGTDMDDIINEEILIKYSQYTPKLLSTYDNHPVYRFSWHA